MEAEEDLFDNCEEEFEFSNYSNDVSNSESDPDSEYFDRVVGALQDIVISEAFEKMQRAFVKKHAGIFDMAEENKPEYMGIFKLYQNEVESYLNQVRRE